MTPTRRVVLELLEAYDRHDLERLAALHDPGVRVGLGPADDDVDLEAWLAIFERVVAVVPDLRVRALTLVTDGGTAMLEVQLLGSNTAPLHLRDGDRALLGTDVEVLPPTGRTVAVTVAGVLHVADGLLVGERYHWPPYWLWEALGLVRLTPVPAAAP